MALKILPFEQGMMSVDFDSDIYHKSQEKTAKDNPSMVTRYCLRPPLRDMLVCLEQCFLPSWQRDVTLLHSIAFVRMKIFK